MELKIPRGKEKWLDFLSNGENKNDLMAVFGKYPMSSDVVSKANSVPMIFCGWERVWEIFSNVKLKKCVITRRLIPKFPCLLRKEMVMYSCC